MSLSLATHGASGKRQVFRLCRPADKQPSRSSAGQWYLCSSPSMGGSLLRDSPGFSPDSLFNHAGIVNHLPVSCTVSRNLLLCKGIKIIRMSACVRHIFLCILSLQVWSCYKTSFKSKAAVSSASSFLSAMAPSLLVSSCMARWNADPSHG